MAFGKDREGRRIATVFGSTPNSRINDECVRRIT